MFMLFAYQLWLYLFLHDHLSINAFWSFQANFPTKIGSIDETLVFPVPIS